MPGEDNSGNNNINNSQSEIKNNEVNKNEVEKSIPYSRFKEVNDKFKDVSSELEAYRKKEKEENDKKLLEEKNFQELIGKKDSAFKELESKYNQEVLKNKIEKLSNKILNSLSKNNIIDAEDGLKFIKQDDLLDSDKAEDEINNRIKELVKNKPYLFKNVNNRSNTENNVAGNQSRDTNSSRGNGGGDPILTSLARKLSTN